MFSSSATKPKGNIVPSTVGFKLNRKAGRLDPLSPTDKMKCAVRKILVKMSDADDHGCRYFIDGNKIEVLTAPQAQPVREGELQTYRARGRCKVGVCHPEGHKSIKLIEFSVSFRDSVDELGLADVEYIDPSTIDEIPRSMKLQSEAFQ